MSPRPAYDPTGVEFYTISSFKFACGTILPEVKVAYRSFNPSSTAGVVLIPTCYGGHINTTLNFTDAPNDCLAKYHVVVVAMLGNGESSSPSNKKMFPEPGELRYEDCIRSQHQLLTEHLDVKGLEAVIGFSMGGQQAHYWSVMYPEFMKKVVPICSSARTSPHNYAFLEGPIGALTNSIDYVTFQEVQRKIRNGEDVGEKLRALRPEKGLRAFGRAYSAWLTSATWFREEWWGKKDGGMGFGSVEDFVVHGAEEGFVIWHPEDLLALGRMWQLGDVSRVIPGKEMELESLGKGPGEDEKYKEALGVVQSKVLCMPCASDQYFPPEDEKHAAELMKHGIFLPIPSIWGHVAGGGMNPKDVVWMNEKIGAFMADQMVK